MKQRIAVQHLEPLDLKTSGTRLKDMVLELAPTFGWLRWHQRPGRTTDGYIKDQIQGDRGLPDLILVRAPYHVCFAETKSRYEKLSPAQRVWRDAFVKIPSVDYWVWRAKDWPNIVQFLADPGPVGKWLPFDDE